MRRGVDRAKICSIALSTDVQWLAVSSDKGTVHIFSLRVRVGGDDPFTLSNFTQNLGLLDRNSSNSLDAFVTPSTGANPGSSLSFMKGKEAYLCWSFGCQIFIGLVSCNSYIVSVELFFSFYITDASGLALLSASQTAKKL